MSKHNHYHTCRICGTLVRNGYACPECEEAKADAYSIDEDLERDRYNELREGRRVGR
jgi:hypothetical protein